MAMQAFLSLRRKIYSDEEIAHFERSKTVQRIVKRKGTASSETARAYSTRIATFAQYVFQQHGKKELDDFIEELKNGNHDPYEILADFALFLQISRKDKPYKLSTNVQRVIVNTAKRFLRFSGVAVNNEDFKDNVSLPRKEYLEKQALEKKDIIEILNGCRNMRLKTAMMFCAVLGPRPIEAMAVRLKDLNLEADPATVTFRAEFSKMSVARTRYLTKELTRQLKLWIKTKYETRRTTVKGPGSTLKHIIVTPKSKPEDLVFAALHHSGINPRPEILYDVVSDEFARLLDSIGRGDKKENGRDRKISIKTFRDYVKSTISDLGHSDYSEYWIGHAGSTYYQKSEKEKIAIFQKLENYLTYLDYSTLEARGADIQTALDQQKEVNKKLQDQLAKVPEQIEATVEKKIHEILSRVDISKLPKS
jgi:integrase